MYTASSVLARRNELLAAGRSKAAVIRECAPMCTSWPYVFGAWNCDCTPPNRERCADNCRAKHPDYAEKIASSCPVLIGKQLACDGCIWVDTLCNDCRGYTHMLLEWVGLQLWGDSVTTQKETKSNWVLQGDISEMPDGLIACIFRPSHTGMYLGDGTTSDCSISVRAGTMPGSPRWQEFGIPAGLYSNTELLAAGVAFDPARNVPTIRKGARGPLVERLQVLLIGNGIELNVDGIFGAKTETALKAYQTANGLKADGVCGPKTWASLGVSFDDVPELPPVEEQPEEPVEEPTEEPEIETVSVPLDELADLKSCLDEMTESLYNLSNKIGKWIERGKRT